MMVGPPLSGAPNQGPPPSYDSVVANDEFYARRLTNCKYSQQELGECDDLINNDRRNSSSYHEPLSLPLNVSSTSNYLTGASTATSTHHQQHYCPFMYVNPHHPHVMGHHLRHLRDQANHHHLSHTATEQSNHSCHNANPQEILCQTPPPPNQGHFSEDIVTATSNEPQLAVGERGGLETNKGIIDRPTASGLRQSSFTPATPQSSTTDSKKVTPETTIAEDINNNNNVNLSTPLNTSAPASRAEGEQILSPKQMVLSGRQQRLSCHQQYQNEGDESIEMTSPSCDCQEVLLSTATSSSPPILPPSTMLATHLCQCQQMAQMSCANALCHCTEQSFRGATTDNSGMAAAVLVDERRFINETGGQLHRPRSDSNYDCRYIGEDQQNNKNEEGLSNFGAAKNFFADSSNVVSDDIANNNSITISSASRCALITEENNDLAITPSPDRFAASSPSPAAAAAVAYPVTFRAQDLNNNNPNDRLEGGEPPRPPIRTTSRYSSTSRPSPIMPDDQESASDLNNNNCFRNTREPQTSGDNNCSNHGRFCDPLLYENGVIRIDMSKIIDQTGLPTYEAALRLESSGYV